MVDAVLLQQAGRALGTTTYSSTVALALQEAVRNAQARGILEFVGKDVWSGDLGEMRDDQPPPAKRRARSRRAR